MNTNFQKIIDIIQASDISQEEQKNLIVLFDKADDKDLESVAELLSENPALVSDINDNYKAKHLAMMTGDLGLWKKIIEEEERRLERIGE